MKNALNALTCFSRVEHISEITSGASQHCFKINADNNVFFAKTIHNDIEPKIALSAAIKKLSPSVIYSDEHWLVTEFINANNLAETMRSGREKVNHAIKLMGRCHQLNEKPAELIPSTIMNNLIAQSHLSTQKNNELLLLAESILPSLSYAQNLVCCHGDVNFSNILIDQKHSTWLVDYECASSAPREYDLAMFIAVNNINENKIPYIIEQYEQQFCSVNIDINLLNNYLAFSYFINSLWYFNTSKSRDNITFFNLHQQQWEKFISASANK